MSAASAAAASQFPRPQLATEYSAPADPLEASLAEIWQGVLGLERVGVHDNFFDLGGDSVIGIQMIAQAASRGIHFQSEQLFEHQTVASLARWLAARESPPKTSPRPHPSRSGPRPRRLSPTRTSAPTRWSGCSPP